MCLQGPIRIRESKFPFLISCNRNIHFVNDELRRFYSSIVELTIEIDEQVVAVKQLNLNGHQGNQEFIVEVLMLSLLRHSNLVTLIGYCADGDQRLLVYEYMPLGSLENHLFGNTLFSVYLIRH